MQYELMNYLRCPITKAELKLKVIKEFTKEYNDSSVKEICDGLLIADNGFIYPIIDGIPRMLLEAMYDYADFLKHNISHFADLRQSLEERYRELINYCRSKNKKTKHSFEFEWSFLNAKKNDRIWHEKIPDLIDVVIVETEKDKEILHDKAVIDVGCGHGFITSQIGQISKCSIGIEISKAVEAAYQNNRHKNAWYIQGDLQFLPFDNSTFDLLYCSGVIHHTNNTELSLSLIEPVIKTNGSICLWLYHPQTDIIHNAFLFVRGFIKLLPLKIAFLFLTIFIFPITFLIKRLKRRDSPNYREEMINLLDFFTPEFRHEIPHVMAETWLRQRKYRNIKISSQNTFGFSIIADKSEINHLE